MSRKDKKKKSKSVYAENVTDSYDEPSRVITAHEAHRDVVYELPSFPRQIKECFMIQMKRYTKQKVMWIAIVLLILMPVLFYVFKSFDALKTMLPTSDVTNIYIASLLQFMPIIIPLLASIACGSMISQEFNERTVYLSLPLPMPRSAFFFGKFLAGLVLIEGVVTAAYGIAMILAMSVTTKTYTAEIFGSMLVSMTYVFFCCSLTYALSTKLKRGSTILPFILMAAVLPIVAMALAELVSSDMVATIASYFPTFSGEMAIYSLGDTTPFSIYGIGHLMMPSLTAEPGKNTLIMMIVSLLLGFVMLIAGEKVIKRRDM